MTRKRSSRSLTRPRLRSGLAQGQLLDASGVPSRALAPAGPEPGQDEHSVRQRLICAVQRPSVQPNAAPRPSSTQMDSPAFRYVHTEVYFTRCCGQPRASMGFWHAGADVADVQLALPKASWSG